MRILIAGVGNIFLSDDAFGCEVVRALGDHAMPEGVEMVDFGIRGVHLAYQLLDGYDVLVLVDAAPRGNLPGTVSLLEVRLDEIEPGARAVSAGEAPLLDVHGMAPASVLAMLSSLGGSVGRMLVVAGEPGSVDEGLGMSDALTAAVPDAARLVLRTVNDLVQQKEVSNR